MRFFHFAIAVVAITLAFTKIDNHLAVAWVLWLGSVAVISILAYFGIYIRLLTGSVFLAGLVFASQYWNGFQMWVSSGNPDRQLNAIADNQFAYSSDAVSFVQLGLPLLLLSLYLYKSLRRPKA